MAGGKHAIRERSASKQQLPPPQQGRESHARPRRRAADADGAAQGHRRGKDAPSGARAGAGARQGSSQGGGWGHATLRRAAKSPSRKSDSLIDLRKYKQLLKGANSSLVQTPSIL
jgi:hypothetical protein